VSGQGCKPGATVTLGIEASHATGRTIAQGTATSGGTFNISYTLPYEGEPTAELSADCVNPAGQQITAVDILFAYTAATAAQRIAPGASLTVSGGGCAPGATVTVTVAASHASGETVGTGTANASGTFSITVKVPYRGQPDGDVTASCNPEGTAVVVPVEYTSAP
jgi:hypothetical protein